MKIKYAVIGLVLAVLSAGTVHYAVGSDAVGANALSGKNDTSDGLYRVENCKVVLSAQERASLRLTLKGPANKLALILFPPNNGSPVVHIVEKEQMIANTRVISMPMPGFKINEGPWILTVKTVDPEKVVLQKTI